MTYKNTHIYKLLAIVIVAFVSSCQNHEEIDNQVENPNIILIYTDQQRFNTIHALGNPHISTPNLDRLCKNGIAFKNTFITAPACVPSRSSLMTGMYPSSNQTLTNHHWGGRTASTLPLHLKDNGYQTAIIGKNHTFMDTTDIDVFMDVNASPAGRLGDGRVHVEAAPWNLETDPMHQLTDSTFTFINQTEKPFFLWLSYLYPHSPFVLPEPYFSMYDSVDIPQPKVEPEGLVNSQKPFRQQFHQHNTDLLLDYDSAKTMRMKHNYYGMISLVDNEIGRLISFLKEKGLDENTILIFTSDHGDYMGDHHLYTKSPAMYDCLMRVPMIVSWPKKFKQNKIKDELISHIDIFPTICDMLGLQYPAQLEGKSFKKILTGEEGYKESTYVFGEYGLPGGNPITSFAQFNEIMPDYPEQPLYWSKGIPWEGNPISLAGKIWMVRSKNHKLVLEKGGQSELYDLVNDPYELTNLYGDKGYIEIQELLTDELTAWMDKRPVESATLSDDNLKMLLQRRNEGKPAKGMYKQ